jgi:hypothetical protein
LGNDLILATDETLQVSANGTDWVVATGNNKAWATADDAVTLITSLSKVIAITATAIIFISQVQTYWCSWT